jgi:CubicO group peptidase (beta-lactamase class C family)
MTLLLRYTALALILVLHSGAASAQTDKVAQVDGIFARHTSETPGCAVAAAQNGKSLVSRAYGMADLENGIRNTPGTVFEARSISKQFTAAAIVLLEQRGKLSLDDDVRKFVPELPFLGHTVTIRHLLTRTSGLRDWGEVASVGGWPRTTRLHTHAHVLDLVRRQNALNYRPGDEYSYTNTGFNLLAVIVDRTSGWTFAEFSKKELFEPLGMTSTQWRDDFTRIVKARAQAYRAADDGSLRILMPFENVHGNGGLLTAVGDLLRWNENLTTGKVGGPEFIQKMQEQMRLNGGRQIQYAKGLVVSSYRGVREVSHGGSTAGYRAFLARYPAQNLSVALLCNIANVNPTSRAHEVADIFLEGAPSVAAPRPAFEIPPARLAALAGLYRNPRSMDVLRLSVDGRTLRTAANVVLTPVSERVFRIGSAGDEIRFSEDNGPARTVLLLTADGDTVPHERVNEFTPASARMAEFAGEYYNEVVEVTCAVSVQDGRPGPPPAAGLVFHAYAALRGCVPVRGRRYAIPRNASAQVAGFGCGRRAYATCDSPGWKRNELYSIADSVSSCFGARHMLRSPRFG